MHSSLRERAALGLSARRDGEKRGKAPSTCAGNRDLRTTYRLSSASRESDRFTFHEQNERERERKRIVLPLLFLKRRKNQAELFIPSHLTGRGRPSSRLSKKILERGKGREGPPSRRLSRREENHVFNGKPFAYDRGEEKEREEGVGAVSL